MDDIPPAPAVRRVSLTAEQQQMFDEACAQLTMVPTIEIKEPSDPEVVRAPRRYRPLDELVAEFGTRFERHGATFDISQDVAGRLGQGLVAALVFVSSNAAPRTLTPDEVVVCGLDPAGPQP